MSHERGWVHARPAKTVLSVLSVLTAMHRWAWGHALRLTVCLGWRKSTRCWGRGVRPSVAAEAGGPMHRTGTHLPLSVI